jgi:probable rRNA maturation factor
MLADSVEAAVRSMNGKTEGKIEGLVRKIIKEKLDDSQLDLCDLTLRDLDLMAKAFLRVFSGYFHEREEYPDLKSIKSNDDKPADDANGEENGEVDGEEDQASADVSTEGRKEDKLHLYIEDKQQQIKLDKKLEELFRNVAAGCLEQEGIKPVCEVDITLTDDADIKDINRKFRDIDTSTDVLSFPLVDMKDGAIQTAQGDYDLDEEVLMLGDLVISTETALRQAAEYGHCIERELAFLTAHGVYHLLGYDHVDEATEKAMMDKQEQVLGKLGLERK